ncbi:MAG: 16S rRNA (cytidine(1402)-2'-O)-methyltransferase [bacterium]
MDPGLYIVGTPIGNLGDITFRAVETLKAADVILAEDTRHTRKLLARYDIHAPMLSCHRFNEAARAEKALEAIRAGRAVALVTDSGMPGISDPGARVVAACRAAGFPVTAIPGPTAVATAVALSGMGGRGYHFEGFLPHKSGARKRRLGELAAEEQPVVLFESPYRLLKLMTEIEEVMGPRRVFLGRELTKQFEECIEGAPADVRAAFAGRTVKGEQVVVIAPAERRARPAMIDTAEGGC